MQNIMGDSCILTKSSKTVIIRKVKFLYLEIHLKGILLDMEEFFRYRI